MLPPESAVIRLLIVDDHEILRMGLRSLFSHAEGIEVVGDADSVDGAVTAVVRLAPDLVLLDMRLPDGTGVEACREILSARPETRILFLTSYDDEDAMLAAVFAGAHGFLLKEIDGESLVRAVRNVAAGESTLDPAAARVVLDKLRTLPRAPVLDSRLASLSSQEQRVAALVAEGKTNKEIAAALGLSDKTVKNYLSSVFQKLQVHRRSQAATLVSGHSLR